MISPEILRKVKFFDFLSDVEYEKIALIAESVTWEEGEKVYSSGDSAGKIYFLLSGGIALELFVDDEDDQGNNEVFYVEMVAHDEMFGLESLIPPNICSLQAVASIESEGVFINSEKLLTFTEENQGLNHKFMKKLSEVVFTKLSSSRVELVTARL